MTQWKRLVFSHFLNIIGDLAVQLGFRRSFHHRGTVNVNVWKSDLSFCNGTMRCCSLTDRRLLDVELVEVRGPVAVL